MYIYLPIAAYSPGAERDFKYTLRGVFALGRSCAAPHAMCGAGGDCLGEAPDFPCVLSVGFRIHLA